MSEIRYMRFKVEDSENGGYFFVGNNQLDLVER